MGSLSMFIQMVVYAYSVLEVLHMNDRLITVSIQKRKSNNRIKKAQKWSPTCTHRVGTMQDTPKGNKLRNTKTKLKSQTKTCLNKGTTSKILPKSNPSKKKKKKKILLKSLFGAILFYMIQIICNQSIMEWRP